MTNDSYDTMSIICRCEALPGTGRVEQFGKHVTDVYRVFYVRLSVYILTIVKEKIIIIIIIRRQLAHGPWLAASGRSCRVGEARP